MTYTFKLSVVIPLSSSILLLSSSCIYGFLLQKHLLNIFNIPDSSTTITSMPKIKCIPKNIKSPPIFCISNLSLGMSYLNLEKKLLPKLVIKVFDKANEGIILKIQRRVSPAL